MTPPKNIINIPDGSNVYFTSDTHFNHSNIIKFCDRPFKDIEDMNNSIICNWNSKVPIDGLIFILGDFAWGGFPVWEKLVSQLNGRKILIKGNHDMRQNLQNDERLNRMFEYVCNQLLINIEGRNIYLNHYPFLCYSGTYSQEPTYQLFGHVHTHQNSTGKDDERLKNLFPYQYDVGVDNNNFTPISWTEVDNIIKNRLI